MKRLLLLLRTLPALGLVNLWRVVLYRLGVRLGFNPVRRLHAAAPAGVFFRAATKTRALAPNPEWRSSVRYFGIFPVALTGAPPDWHANPLTGVRVSDPSRPWWCIPDFDPAVGDIKGVWEASRFDWVLVFAQQAVAGETAASARLQQWLEDWLRHNPPYVGPNWKCGQEASIRVMHLAMAALLLDQVEAAEPALLDLVELHLQRIAPTLSYAVAQDNNHGTSEAAALFIGGSWLAVIRPQSSGARWAALGRRWLENRVRRLIAADGSFSQYSLNYHRVVLDTLSMAEVWRRRLVLPAFSPLFLGRAQAAAEWLRCLLQPDGDAPNLGANDGARLLPLTAGDYRDCRPSVQLAAALFLGQRALAQEGDWNLPLHWLDIPLPDAQAADAGSRLFDDGGYACMRVADAFVLTRYPRFRFRPSQADALHVDFWRAGRNILRDAGSYSYNAGAEWVAYFPGTAAHNTVQFDGHDQMPRLSRFLFGPWLALRGRLHWRADAQTAEFAAACRDHWGAEQRRTVTLSSGRLQVSDQLSGFAAEAVLRWRLAPGAWVLAGDTVSDGVTRIRVTAPAGVALRIALREGWESRYYLQRTALPVLEVTLAQPGTITTSIEWAS